MTSAIAHRGPDGQGLLEEPGINLGHRRLSIIDLEGGAQPMDDVAREVAITFNGEIYNYRELRAELEALGHRFARSSDTEVILEAYRRWGAACVERFDGIFAFALWDRARRTLLLARDHLGIKPLYTRVVGGELHFASEMRALIRAPGLGGKLGLDPEALAFYLSYYYTQRDRTLLRDIVPLPPGETMEWREGRVERRRYWRPDASRSLERSPAELGEEIRARLARATVSQLVADVPVGLALSGGLDSSAMLAAILRSGKPAPQTFTQALGEKDDESPAAASLAAKFGAPHWVFRTSLREIAGDLPRVLEALEDPSCCYTALTVFAWARALRAAGMKVCLVGEGSDELFAGYTRYKIFGDRYRALPLGPRAGFYRWPGHFGFRSGALARDFPGLRDVRTDAAVSEPLRRALGSASDPLNGALAFDLEHELVHYQLMRIDKATMAHGIEARVPFLARDFVDFAMTVPGTAKIAGHREKAPLREAMRPWLPEEVLFRRKGASQYLLGPLVREHVRAPARDLYASSRLVRDGWVHPTLFARVDRMLDRAPEKVSRTVAEQRFWALYSLETWYRSFVAG